jgi:hypothetical protein
MNGIKTLLHRFQIPFDSHQIAKVLTHNSIELNNNSRYVFLGQFAFKGKISEWVFNNISGTGTQLQHYLGNLLSQKRIESYYDKWKIKKVRQAVNNELSTQKHIFVYAVLGYIIENATEEQLEHFIFNQFIKSADHLLPNNYKHKNQWDQLLFMCKQHFDKKPQVAFELDTNKINHVQISVSNEVLSKCSSISFKYAKKKAIKEALKMVATIIETQLLHSDEFKENEAKRIQEATNKALELKNQKQEQHLERIKKHAEKMAERRRIAKIEAELQDKKRKQAKQIVKEKTSRKGADTIYREYSAEEIAAMSVSKRRNLQDKGIIPKGI